MICFEAAGWEDHLYWRKNDRKTLRRVNELNRHVLRHPFAGLGKPEPLKHHLADCWSRRISAEHRLVYLVRDGGCVVIAQCRYHY